MLDLLLHHEQHKDEEALHGVGQIRDVEELRPLLVVAHEERDELRQPGDAHDEEEAQEQAEPEGGPNMTEPS